MPTVTKTRRTTGALTTAVLAAALLAGCTPAPTPLPTQTPLFATEQEAYAAAEATYRAYVDAANERRLRNTAAADPQKYLLGEALADDIDGLRNLEEQGIHVEGATAVISFLGEAVSFSQMSVKASACVDVSATRVINAEGVDVTPTSRPTLVSVSASFRQSESKLSIDRLTPGTQSCAR